MKRAPLLITTLCRYEHFKQCIESLAKNSLACETELFIGLDYPLRETHWEGYKKIKEYISSGIKGFANVYCIEQDKNLGWYENFLSVREKIYERYECFIYTEDDNVFAPHFLEYMNLALQKYRWDERVYAVSGYCYPILEAKYSGDIFGSKVYFSASGYGVWKEKEDIMYSQITVGRFKELLKNRCYMNKLKRASKNQFCNFVRGMMEYKSELIKNGDVQKLDLSFGLQMLATDKVMVMPCKSLVKNCGYDGSGMNCGVIENTNSEKPNHRSYDFGKQPIDETHIWSDLCEVSGGQNNQINNAIDSFFAVPFAEYFRTYICYMSICILGLERTKKVFSKILK